MTDDQGRIALDGEARRRIRRATIAAQVVRTEHGMLAGWIGLLLTASSVEAISSSGASGLRFVGEGPGEASAETGLIVVLLAFAALLALLTGVRAAKRRPLECALALAIALLSLEVFSVAAHGELVVFGFVCEPVVWVCVWTLWRLRRFGHRHPDTYAARWFQRQRDRHARSHA